MYNVSQNFITKSHSPVQSYALRGTIGATEIGEENILKGSLKFVEQSTKKDFNIGYAYMGELTCTFVGVNIAKYQWLERDISLELGLLVGNMYEYVPIKSYTIKEANITSSGVVVKAYDYMGKFDKAYPETQLEGTVEEILEYICGECGVELEPLTNPNKDYQVSLIPENDIETYRDVVYWLAQLLGGFATINRANKLEIRQYPSEPCDIIQANQRLTGIYGEYVTNYNGLYVTVDDTVEYYGSEAQGSTLTLGANPFVKGNKNTRQLMMGNIVTTLANVQYVPFKTSIPCGFHYDLGDVIALNGGLGDSTKKFCIMSMAYTYNGMTIIQGFGENPSSKMGNKTDKHIQGLINNQKANEMAFYELSNPARLIINSSQTRRIARLKMSSKTSTRIQINIEINLKTTDTDQNSITRAIVEYTASGLVQTLHPQETYIDGYHVLHLMYILSVQSNWTDYFVIDLTAESGTIEIERGAIKVFASGLGLVGDGTWDGTFDIEEPIGAFNLDELKHSEHLSEAIGIIKPDHHSSMIGQTIGNFNMSELTLEEFSDSFHFGDYLTTLTWGDVAEFTWGAVEDNYSWGSYTE